MFLPVKQGRPGSSAVGVGDTGYQSSKIHKIAFIETFHPLRTVKMTKKYNSTFKNEQ